MSTEERVIVGDPKARAIQALKEMVNSEGWAVAEQIVRKWLMDDLDALASWKKPEGQDDSYQRGLIARDKAFLGTFRALISEYEAEVSSVAASTQEPPAVGSPYEAEDNPQDGKV